MREDGVRYTPKIKMSSMMTAKCHPSSGPKPSRSEPITVHFFYCHNTEARLSGIAAAAASSPIGMELRRGGLEEQRAISKKKRGGYGGRSPR